MSVNCVLGVCVLNEKLIKGIDGCWIVEILSIYDLLVFVFFIIVIF